MIQFQSRSMSDPRLSNIDFKNKMVLVSTTLALKTFWIFFYGTFFRIRLTSPRIPDLYYNYKLFYFELSLDIRIISAYSLRILLIIFELLLIMLTIHRKDESSLSFSRIGTGLDKRENNE